MVFTITLFCLDQIGEGGEGDLVWEKDRPVSGR